MAMTATERSRVLRERRACGKVVLSVVVGEQELAEIARAGYAEAASTDRKGREAPIRLFLRGLGGSCNEGLKGVQRRCLAHHATLSPWFSQPNGQPTGGEFVFSFARRCGETLAC
jgi:hypothetical protein